MIRLSIERLFEEPHSINVNRSHEDNYVQYIFHAAMISHFITHPKDADFRVFNSKNTINIMRNIQNKFCELAASPFESSEFKQFNKLSDESRWETIKALLSDKEAEDVLRKKYIYFKEKRSTSLQYKKAFGFLIKEEQTLQKDLTDLGYSSNVASREKEATQQLHYQRIEQEKKATAQLRAQTDVKAREVEARALSLMSSSSTSTSSLMSSSSLFLKATFDSTSKPPQTTREPDQEFTQFHPKNSTP